MTNLTKPGDLTTRATTAHVQVFSQSGAQLADSRAAVELDEFRCPTRYYLPAGDVDMGRLERIPLRTTCPYKGTCDQYFAVQGDAEHRPIAWAYSDPIAQVADIRGRVAFWNEQVRLVVDGVEWKKAEL